MFNKILLLATLPLLFGCVSSDGDTQPTQTAPVQKSVSDPAQSGLASFAQVAKKVEPIAERSCKALHPKQDAKFCDFVIQVDRDSTQPANAYQSIGKDGRPLITFNIAMIKSVQNDHEFAFILGHEAGHQIASHLIKTRNNQVAGAVLGGILAATLGGDVQSGADLGGLVGARSYSKGFELQADRIGTHIAMRAGYSAVTGAKSFNRTTGSNSFLSTHPPSQDRIDTVNATAAKIAATRKSTGKFPEITW